MSVTKLPSFSSLLRATKPRSSSWAYRCNGRRSVSARKQAPAGRLARASRILTIGSGGSRPRASTSTTVAEGTALVLAGDFRERDDCLGVEIVADWVLLNRTSQSPPGV